jgi:hopanoid biosynthesis associated protein HpnK
MKKLIVNGDDFGLTRGVNAGIVRAFREGILTSTTLIASGDEFDDAVELARANPGLGVGCHLVLIGGRAVAPAGDVPSLADKNGKLPGSLLALVGKLSCKMIHRRDIETELRAQIERVRRAGIEPTHVDTHKHTHSHPQVMEALVRVAGETGIRRMRKPFEDPRNFLGIGPHRNGRIPVKQRALVAAARTAAPLFRRLAKSHGLATPDHFYGLRATGRLEREAILELLERLPDGTSELMCHPGICDEDLERTPTRLKRQREAELAALTDAGLRKAAAERGIRLVSYRELN